MGEGHDEGGLPVEDEVHVGDAGGAAEALVLVDDGVAGGEDEVSFDDLDDLLNSSDDDDLF